SKFVHITVIVWTSPGCYRSHFTSDREASSMKTVRLLVVFLVCLFPYYAFGQFDTAEVLGTVRDGTGAVLVQSAVTLINQSTGIAMKTIADSSGNYTFLNVKSGTYTISAEQTGFRIFSSSQLIVNVGARQRVDITMEVGAITETVEVVGAAEVLETDRSD